MLVVGSTGTMGRRVVRQLRALGVPVRVLVRRRQPDVDGVEQMVGDLARPADVARALAGVGAAFYVSPHADNETILASVFVREANRAGVRVVFAGVHVSRRTPASWARHQLFRRLFPAYRGKLTVGALIERSCPGATLLVPTSFYENDELFVADLVAGSFPTPLRGVNRVAVDDVAAVAAAALLDPAFAPGTHLICGPRSWDGAACAAVWARTLDRPVAYTGDDPVQWAETADCRLPAGRKGADFRASYGLLGRLRMGTRPRDVAAVTRLLGRPPTSYETYVGRLARDLTAVVR